MKAWRLALKLLWHTLRGRGGDDVYLYHAESFGLFDIDLPCHRKDWRLTSMSWTGDADHVVSLEAYPAVGEKP